MPDSMESEPERVPTTPAAMFPRPRSLGSFVILLTILAFTAGRIRNELALTLLGTVFLVILVYCFFGVFLLGLFKRGSIHLLSMVITSETVPVGAEGELNVSFGTPKKYFWQFPAILLRCELRLKTRDGREIRCFINPGFESCVKFPVMERGAYYSGSRSTECDRLAVFDAPGFFRLDLPLRHDEGPRLLAVPPPAGEVIPVSLKPGGSAKRQENHFRKSDELISHRPYVPGDDPRRINWKLYSHAPLGDLFVREGEGEPPPHSRLLVLVDTEADTSLYSLDEARRAVDLLCENALAAAYEFSSRGMEILIGYTGGVIADGGTESGGLPVSRFAPALAHPAAIMRNASAAKLSLANLTLADLPRTPEDAAVLVLALPRPFSDGKADGMADGYADASALDRFLKSCKQGAAVVFIPAISPGAVA